METSKTLLDRLRATDDQEAWREFDRIYRPLILHWLRRDGDAGADLEDLAQEVLAVVHREIAAFDRQRAGSFRRWLRQVAAHRLQGYYRERASRPRAASSGVLAAVAAPADDLTRHWEDEHNRFLISRLLGMIDTEFSPNDLRAFRRFVLDGVTPARKVAEEIGVSENVVLLAKSRVLRRLREVAEGFLD